MNRIFTYYSMLLPIILLALFGPGTLWPFLTFWLVFATIMLPYEKKFLEKSLRALPGFALLTLVFGGSLLFLIDFANFLSRYNPYFSVLVIVPAYLGLRIIDYPWVYLETGLGSPKAFFEFGRRNWLILAVLSALFLVFQVSPLVVAFLGPTTSKFIFSRIKKYRA